MCPASWNSRSFCSTTTWPRWMSGAVGSMPSFTRSGRPSSAACSSFSASAPSGSESTALRARNAGGGARFGSGVRASGANARLSPRVGGPSRCRLSPRRPAASAAAGALPAPAEQPMADDRSGTDRRGSRAARRLHGAAPGGASTTRAARAAAEQAPPRARAARLVGAGAGLDGLRDDDGGRPGPARARGQNEFKAARNSILRRRPRPATLAILTGNENRILVASSRSRSNVKRAVIAIEDKRFYQHKGVDYQGIMRAIWAGRAPPARRPGRLDDHPAVRQERPAWPRRTARSSRSCKEAALAYQLERKWSKDKILTEYLNTVYFGEGAYGIESAARVYFGWNHPGCEPDCAGELEPAEAALLAGMIASPVRIQPDPEPGRGAGAAQPRARANAGPGPDHDLGVRERRAAGASAAVRDRARRTRSARRPTSPPGSRTSWSALRDGEHLRRRAEDPHDARPRAPAGRRAGDRRAARGRRAERRAGRDRQRHRRHSRDGRRARTSRSGRSTSPPRDIASPARRSSRSRSWPRSRTASLPARRSSPVPKTLKGPRGDFKVAELRGPLRRVRSRWRARPRSRTTPCTPRSATSWSARRPVARVAQKMGMRTPDLAEPGDGAGRAAGRASRRWRSRRPTRRSPSAASG